MEEKLKNLADNFSKYFNRLNKRQKKLFFLLIITVVSSLYYNIIYKGQLTALSKVRRQATMASGALNKIKAQVTDLTEEKASLERSSDSLKALRRKLASIETELPTQSSIPLFLKELVRQAAGCQIEFNSIRPKSPKEKKDYAELNIEMKFNTNYSGLANYINRLESPSHFLKASNIVIENMKDGLRGELDVTLTLSTLLAEKDMPKKEKEEIREILPLDIERSPFVSQALAPKTGKKEEFYLSGVITSGKSPSAIINNEVYRVGDVIGNKKVVKIMPKMVILEYGREEIVLTLEKNK